MNYQLSTVPGSASVAQCDYLDSLIDGKNLFADSRIFDSVNAMDAEEFEQYKARMKQWFRDEASKTQASAMIERLKALPWKAREEQNRSENAAQGYADIPAGRYAITGDDGTTDFYKVDRPVGGRWDGYTFVKLLIASGGHGIESLSEQRVRGAAAMTITHRIEEAGVRESMERFGRAIGSCGHCGRVLTNEESRERGIGPVCAGKMGWS